MRRYVIGRLAQVIPLVVGITALVFLLVNAVPGNPVEAYVDQPGTSPADVQNVRHSFGLDQPLSTRYFTWLGNVARGDLGESMVNYRSVRGQIVAVLPNTLILTVGAFVIALGLSIPLGVYCALRHNTWIDQIGSAAAVAGVSVPSFWFGLMLILLFSVRLRWLPSDGIHTIGEHGLWDLVRHLLLPALALSVGGLGNWTRYVRGQMLEVIREHYVVSARAKGLRERTVVIRHALRNALLPLLTLVGLHVPHFFSGALIIETIFGWPGIGRLTFEAAVGRDYPMIMGTVLCSALLVIVGNLLADIGYGLFDPRIVHD